MGYTVRFAARVLVLSLALLIHVQRAAIAQDGTSTVSITPLLNNPGDSPEPAGFIELRAAGAGGTLSSSVHGTSRAVVFRGVRPGPYRLSVDVDGYKGAVRNISVGAGQDVKLTVALEPQADRPGPTSPPEPGAVLGQPAIQDLPSGGSIWSLVSTVDATVVSSLIDNGGLWTGEPALLGSQGSTWTQTGYRLGDLDVTDPEFPGRPLVYSGTDALDGIAVTAGPQPVAAEGPGPNVDLLPRSPGGAWRSLLRVSLAPHSLQAADHATGPPRLAYLVSSADASALTGGPVGRGRLRVLFAGDIGAATRLERRDSVSLHGRTGSGLLNVLATPGPRSQLHFIATVDHLKRPDPTRHRFAGSVPYDRESLSTVQASWRHAEEGSGRLWSATIGYGRGVLNAVGTAPSGAVAVDRLRDGPIPELVNPAHDNRGRFEARVEANRLASVFGGRARIDAGSSITFSRATTANPWPEAVIGELVDGLPARIWKYGYGAAGSSRASRDADAWLSSRFAWLPNLSLDGGVHFEVTSGAARGSDSSVHWRTLSPRFTATWAPFRNDRFTVYGTFGRYRYRLPLTYLSFGDPGGPSGRVYRWEDNGDAVPQVSEIGPLIAYVGACCAAGRPNRIDPGLRPPQADVFTVGFEAKLSASWTVRFAGRSRRDGAMVGSVDVGAGAGAYDLVQISDGNADQFSTKDDRLLDVYARRPSTFGQDAYVLTNPPNDRALHLGLDASLERRFDGRWQLMIGGSAHKSDGYGANRGFKVNENDPGLIGEVFEDPNATVWGSGRLFFDRGYVLKIAGLYAASHDVTVGLVARYQDGQHFARMTIVPDLPQGPIAVQAYTRGLTRFTFLATVDARIQKTFRTRWGRAALLLEGFNILNTPIEVEEVDVMTHGNFRSTSAVQPPRVVRVGLRIER